MTEDQATMDAGYLGFKNGEFFFAATGERNPATLLARLGISKAESARIRGQNRLQLDAARDSFSIRALRDIEPVGGISASLDVLYEDDFILAVNKPAGLLVHADGTPSQTLSDRVAAYLAAKGELLSPQAVQRLDVETTGIVLFSKACEFQGLFDALVADHRLMTKTYLAVVEGAYPKALDRIDAPIGRDRHDAKRMRVAAQGAQSALTFVKRLAVSDDGGQSLLAVTLGTGRKHQIRVHLAHRGYPIVGDALYGHRGELMLHATREEFIHPISGEPVCITAPCPDRIAQLFPGDEGGKGGKGTGHLY